MTKKELVQKLTRLLRDVRKLRRDVDSINRRLNAAGRIAGRIMAVRDED